jgi:N-methylhydantoinase B
LLKYVSVSIEETVDQVRTQPQAATINPITAEVIRHGLLSIPNQIDVNITRTAYSPLIYEYKDYAVGMVDPEGRLISQSEGGVPLFVANALGVAVRDGLAVHGPDGIEPGDVIISNHAATLGQHLNNVVMYTPVYAGPEKADLIAYMCVLVHWLDVGGGVVGSCTSTNSRDIFQEGIQFRSTKLWSRGKPNQDIYRIIEVNTRFPRMLFGDIEAQLAGCMLGRDMVVALADKYGVDDFREAIELMWRRSERIARAAIRQIPDGTYAASSFLDNDGVALDQPVPINIVVRVEGDELTIDFSGISDEVKGPLNSGRDGGAITVARIALKYLAMPHEPANDGSFRPLRVVIPDGKFLSAKAGAPMGWYSSPLPSVVDTVIKAMVEAAPEHVAAGHHGTFGTHSFHGRDPVTGELFQVLNSSHGGWGASLGHDGPGPYKTLTHGDTLDVPIEAQEALYPLRYEKLEFIADSGGAGEFRGGPGMEKVVVAVAPCTAAMNIDRTQCPGWGIRGGRDGAAPDAYHERRGHPPRKILKEMIDLDAGEQIRVLSGGGGGYGDPRRRRPDAVARDVQLGYVTRKAARDVFGVAIGDDGGVIEEETMRLRAER